MVRRVDPLNARVAIVDSEGRPTQEFMLKWQQQNQAFREVLSIITAAANGSGGGGGTPAVRGSGIQSSSNSSYTVNFPGGSEEGDVAIIFMGHGYSPVLPSGWTLVDLSIGTSFQGAVFAKELTAGDISTGSVTVTAGDSFNGVIAIVVLEGPTVAGLRIPGQFQRSTTGSTSVSVGSPAPVSPDLVLLFAGNRANATVSFDVGSSLQAIAATNASGALYNLVASSKVGVGGTASFSTAGSGYYTAVLGVIGA